MNIQTNSYQLAPGVLAQTVLDEAVLLDAQAGAYFSANASASLILQALIEGDTSHRIAEKLVARYVVDEDRAVNDVQACIDDWLARGLIIRRP